jgi:hypothetical protein
MNIAPVVPDAPLARTKSTGVMHTFDEHVPPAQSEPVLHALVSAQPGQLPPQSISVSVPSLIPSLHSAMQKLGVGPASVQQTSFAGHPASLGHGTGPRPPSWIDVLVLLELVVLVELIVLVELAVLVVLVALIVLVELAVPREVVELVMLAELVALPEVVVLLELGVLVTVVRLAELVVAPEAKLEVGDDLLKEAPPAPPAPPGAVVKLRVAPVRAVVRLDVFVPDEPRLVAPPAPAECQPSSPIRTWQPVAERHPR